MRILLNFDKIVEANLDACVCTKMVSFALQFHFRRHYQQLSKYMMYNFLVCYRSSNTMW